jgi:flagellar basal-body rod protein FlgB
VFEASPVFALLSRALDEAALRQGVHTTNIANAGVDGFQRLDVTFDAQLQAATGEMSSTDFSLTASAPRVVSTGEAVRIDQEMALMAKDAMRYQALLGAFEKTTGLLRLAIKEGREG